MTIPILETNAEEMSAKIRSLQCDLGVMRGELAKAEKTALTEFLGPERDKFIARCEQIRRAILAIEASLGPLPARVLVAGDEIMHDRRDKIAGMLGPHAKAANGVANWLGW